MYRSAELLDTVVGQSRWKKSEYGWSQQDESRGSASFISSTSRESSSYLAPVTYTFLPTKVRHDGFPVHNSKSDRVVVRTTNCSR
jgi:hypothetical protein